MLHPVTILALVGSVACAPAPSTADDVALAESPAEQPKTDEAPKDEAPKDEAPDTGEEPPEEPPDEPPPPEPPKPAPQLPPGISTGEVKFINGEVKVEAFLTKMQPRVAKCVVDHGGMTKEKGALEIQFLVRLQGKAEGVEVLERDGVGEEAERCVRKAFKNEWVGTPTSDPTGVVFTYSLERRLEK